MDQERLAGVASTFPAVSMARTWKVWVPSAKPVYSLGELQAVKVALSRLHSKVAPVSLEAKVNVAELLVTVPVGPAVIVVLTGLSTVTVRLAELVVLDPVSTARATMLCEPSATLLESQFML